VVLGLLLGRGASGNAAPRRRPWRAAAEQGAVGRGAHRWKGEGLGFKDGQPLLCDVPARPEADRGSSAVRWRGIAGSASR
jgi:hypothetical protein